MEKIFNDYWSSKNCKAIGEKLHETIKSHAPLIPGIYVAPHYGITLWYYKYNMAMVIKRCKLKQQGQDILRLPPLIKPPYIFQPNSMHDVNLEFAKFNSSKMWINVYLTKMYLSKKCPLFIDYIVTKKRETKKKKERKINTDARSQGTHADPNGIRSAWSSDLHQTPL